MGKRTLDFRARIDRLIHLSRFQASATQANVKVETGVLTPSVGTPGGKEEEKPLSAANVNVGAGPATKGRKRKGGTETGGVTGTGSGEGGPSTKKRKIKSTKCAWSLNWLNCLLIYYNV